LVLDSKTSTGELEWPEDHSIAADSSHISEQEQSRRHRPLSDQWDDKIETYAAFFPTYFTALTLLVGQQKGH